MSQVHAQNLSSHKTSVRLNKNTAEYLAETVLAAKVPFWQKLINWAEIIIPAKNCLFLQKQIF